ncbi:MAG: PEP/pyruvate-binding domain-containing protein, partial [Spirulinaceae cyanobacterium]
MADATMKYVVRLQDLPNAQAMGGKAFQLSRLRQRDLLIPQGFVMTPAAFAASLTREQRDRLHDWQSQTKINVQALQAVLADVRLGEGVQTEILQILAEMFPYGGHFAVRSSALDEDQAQYSLAGQLTTFLSVKLEDLYDKIAQVWRSAYRETVLLYRQRQGLSGLPQPSAVLVQQMLEPSVSGVAFGADPVTGRRNIRLVSAVYGLGTTLVSGESDADTFYVDAHDQIVQRQIARKVKAAYANPLSESGVSIKRIEDDRIDQPTLSDAQILAVASLVRQVGRALAAPQDIEWAIAQTGQLYLLQARPITALPAAPEPTGRYQIWDNSNIAESYSGVTTPLTFAFARRAYTEVYRQFCRVMGISWVEIQRRDRVFANMIGLLQGRIYYNLL